MFQIHVYNFPVHEYNGLIKSCAFLYNGKHNRMFQLQCSVKVISLAGEQYLY